ncbi:L,D-transpeptidase [[Mycobacterium] burgundiense]|uniref:Ig-like domain-containing protein n=1 Tax=[Mycobacterium] burgundiense TaxID=3064286 RepID=A0ABM9LVN3_9MYCO|nr:Ig-like domain-containing protein [Mycolicibacterium sp. MU0053]CAJ1505499.1 Ig-like domain-containing protein [Mycolicibacterium sp. MU0053]
MRLVKSATTGRRRCVRRIAVVLAVIGVALGLTACNSPASPAGVIVDKGAPYADLLIPKVGTSVTDGAIDVSVSSPVTVGAETGVLAAVAMVNEDGKVVQGELSPDGTTWHSAEPLGYSRQYTVSAEALGMGGVARSTAAFQTQSPQDLTMPLVVPSDGAVVGVGQPVAVRFDQNIPDRLAAQRAITVISDPPVQGAFYWMSNREVRWRPAQYWAPGTAVEVRVKTYGVDLGDGLFGQRDLTSRFTIGDEVITTVDDATKTMTVRVNGKVVKSMPVSLGKDRTPTDNGTYLIGDRNSSLVMDSSTFGVPVDSAEGYRLEVDWATQMSYSGIYVHSAPWSVSSQGRANVSNGCLNLSPENAKWFYDNSKRGDLVEVINTVATTLSGTDGLGDWNIPWDRWKAGNATV